MNIVIISTYLPYPLNSGGAQAQYNIIDQLQQSNNITFIFPVNGQNSMKAMKHLQTIWKNVTFKPYSYLRQLSNVSFFLSKAERAIKILCCKNSQRFYVERALKPYGFPTDRSFTSFLNQCIDEVNADVIQIDMYPFLTLVDFLPANIRKVFVHHELRWIRNERLFQNINLTRQERLLLESEKRKELEYLNKYDEVITLTDVDKNTLISAGVSAPISVSPASVNAAPLDFVEWNGTITFLGGYAHVPNSEGVNWLINKVFPLIDWTKYPNVTFNIVGSGWPTNIKNPINTFAVNVLGFVEKLSDVISGSIMCVPILTGSGMRMKILEAAVMNVPFVTTSVGVEGLDFRNDDACLIADSPESFARALESLMTSAEKCQSLTKRASEVFAEKYSVEAVAKRREIILKG